MRSKSREANDTATDNFKRFHDRCVVRAPEVPQRSAVEVILVSWGIAFFEYCFRVPANRIGSYEFRPAQLKTIQVIITLSIFPVFSIYGVGFALIMAAAFFVFHKW